MQVFLLLVFIIVSRNRASQVLLYDLSNVSRCIATVQVMNNLMGNELVVISSFNEELCINTSLYQTRILVLAESGQSILSQTTLLDTNRCDTVVRILIAVDTLSIPVGNSSIACNATRTPGFNCSETPYLQPLLYRLSNCLLTSEEENVTSSVPIKEIHAPLCWYHQCLNGSLISNATLCGVPVCTILYRSNLYLNQCANDTNKTSMSPWYLMAVQLITYRLNYGEAEAYRYVWWLVGTELLERHCYAINHPLSVEEMREKDSFFRRFLTQFEADNAMTHELPCLEIKQHFDSLYNQTMSEMLYNQWYYAAFKFVLMPDRDMDLHAIMLISFFCILPFVLLGFLAYCIYGIRHPHRVIQPATVNDVLYV